MLAKISCSSDHVYFSFEMYYWNYRSLFSVSVGYPLSVRYEYNILNPYFTWFVRPGGNGQSVFYYQLYKIQVSEPGAYIVQGSSYFDSYGYLYVNSFDESDPESNLLTFNDDYGDTKDFRFVAEMDTESTYYVVFTWFAPGITYDTITLMVSGPAKPALIMLIGKP